MDSFLNGLQNSPLGLAIAQSSFLFPVIECVHVLAIVTVMGTIAILDLRLIGVASRERAVTALSRDLLPWTWGAFGVAALSGGLLIVSRAADYAQIPAFRLKFVIMALAAANMLLFHFTTYRKVAAWDEAEEIPNAAKAAGLLSLLLWIGVVTCGRWVGFSI